MAATPWFKTLWPSPIATNFYIPWFAPLSLSHHQTRLRLKHPTRLCVG